jgi:hypothetical protein
MLAALVGFIFALMSVAALARWAALIYLAITETRTADGRIDTRRGITVAVCQSLFHAGPWSVVVALFIAFHIRTEPWAPWLFGGFASGFVLMASASMRVLLQFRKRRHGEANAV